MTHINAFHGAVDEATKEVLAAQAKLEAARTALETKKLEEASQLNQVEPKVEEEPKTEKKVFGRR